MSPGSDHSGLSFFNLVSLFLSSDHYLFLRSVIVSSVSFGFYVSCLYVLGKTDLHGCRAYFCVVDNAVVLHHVFVLVN